MIAPTTTKANRNTLREDEQSSSNLDNLDDDELEVRMGAEFERLVEMDMLNTPSPPQLTPPKLEEEQSPPGPNSQLYRSESPQQE